MPAEAAPPLVTSFLNAFSPSNKCLTTLIENCPRHSFKKRTPLSFRVSPKAHSAPRLIVVNRVPSVGAASSAPSVAPASVLCNLIKPVRLLVSIKPLLAPIKGVQDFCRTADSPAFFNDKKSHSWKRSSLRLFLMVQLGVLLRTQLLGM